MVKADIAGDLPQERNLDPDIIEEKHLAKSQQDSGKSGPKPQIGNENAEIDDIENEDAANRRISYAKLDPIHPCSYSDVLDVAKLIEA